MTVGPLHASLIARRQDGYWRGLLLRGPSGAGKSDLLLRCLGRDWRLAADDRVLVWASADRLYGRRPASLHGLVEARGVGIARLQDPPEIVEIRLAVDLLPSPEAVERHPEAEVDRLLGIELPRLRLYGLEASAPDKLALAFERLHTRL